LQLSCATRAIFLGFAIFKVLTRRDSFISCKDKATVGMLDYVYENILKRRI